MINEVKLAFEKIDDTSFKNNYIFFCNPHYPTRGNLDLLEVLEECLSNEECNTLEELRDIYLENLDKQIDSIFIYSYDAWAYLGQGWNFDSAVECADNLGFTLKDVSAQLLAVCLARDTIYPEVDKLLSQIDQIICNQEV
jgi:hypothetical protein